MLPKPTVRKIINEILKKWGLNITIKEICDMWDLPHRFYHTTKNHLVPMLYDIVEFHEEFQLEQEDFEVMIVSALFHDIIYDSKNRDNEDKSLSFFYSKLPSKPIMQVEPTKLHPFNKVANMIKVTKDHNHKNRMEEIFCMFDLRVVSRDLPGLLEWEEQIFREYEWVNWKDYKKARIRILKKYVDNRTEIPTRVNYVGLQHLIYILENKEPNIFIYAGSFNPFHIGHKDVVDKAVKMCDKLIIAKGKNDDKVIDEVRYEKEFKALQDAYPTKEVISYSGPLADVLKAQEGKITLVRGLRNGFDLEAENALMYWVKVMYPDLKVVYIPCDASLGYISSSAIRNVRKYGEHYTDNFIV